MKPSQLPWKWLLFGLLVVLVLSIALLPRAIGDTSRFGDRVAAELSTWTGGVVKFTGPVRVSFFPDVSVRGQLELKDSTRLPLVKSLTVKEAKISLDLVDLWRGRITIDALRLLKPKILLREGASAMASTQTPQALITDLVATAPVRALHVRKGRIKLGPAHGGALKQIYAHFDAGEETGAISGFGSVVFRDTTIRYSLESGPPATTGEVQSLPVALTLTSKPIKAKISGTASYASEFKLDGDMKVEIDDLRRFLYWVGITLPHGGSLKGFSAAGAFRLSGPTLTFDDGTFSLDGNKAIGSLAVTAAPSRPRLDGTLAFGRLVLDPYLGESRVQGDASGSSPAGQGSLLHKTLFQFFDADLRISAAAISAHTLKLGRGGFTITAKDGVISSEVGELELCGGSADGRLSVDLAGTPKRLNLVANLADIALDSCLEPLAPKIPFKGTGGLKTELSTEGENLAEFTRHLTGNLKLTARDGAVPVDFTRLVAATAPLDRHGWSVDNVNAFSELAADCQITAGHVSCPSLSMRTASGSVTGTGKIDLPEQTLDWSLSVADDVDAAAAPQLIQEAGPNVSIRGSLLQPVIRGADRPTLGDSSLQTGATSPQTVPH